MVTESTLESQPAEVADERPAVVKRRRWTVGEYHAMAEAGILKKEDRVELIDGTIVNMSPIGPVHARCVIQLNHCLNELIRRHEGGPLYISPQNPIRLDEHSEPEPDIALVRLPDDPAAPIGPEHILLLVEVADSSLAYDRDVKLPLYAAAGIPEVWIVALPEQQVEVYRAPSPKGYKRAQFLSEGDTIEVEALADAGSVAIDDLFR